MNVCTHSYNIQMHRTAGSDQQPFRMDLVTEQKLLVCSASGIAVNNKLSLSCSFLVSRTRQEATNTTGFVATCSSQADGFAK